MKTKWHDDANRRKHGGDVAESLFAAQVRCHCGGRFSFVGNVKAGFPDFTCENCGQLVDVKSSPQSERTGNLSISAIPWQGYPDEMLLVTRIKGIWLGEYKRHIVVKEQPRQPTHNSRHAYLKNTEWYIIPWKNFREISVFGYNVQEQ